MLEQKKVLSYYKKRPLLGRAILGQIKGSKNVVYGARSINAQVPKYLEKHTEDWDVFSAKPKQEAMRLEKKLDKKFGGDYFYVEPAEHKGTFKVRSRVTRSGVADFTKPEKKVDYKTVRGVRNASLEWTKNHIKQTLKDKESEFRWDKDREALQRINLVKRAPARKVIQKRDVFSKNLYGFISVSDLINRR
jgi:hypothetical protein